MLTKAIKAAVDRVIEVNVACPKCKTNFLLNEKDIDKKVVRCPFCFEEIKLEGSNE